GSASPMISPDVSALVVNTGDPVVLNCSGESKVEWKGPKDFGNHSTLSIPQATFRDTGTYMCAYVNSDDKSVAAVHLFVRDPSEVWYTPVFRISVIRGGNAVFPCLVTAPEYGSNVSLIMDDNSPLLPGSNYSFSAERGITLYDVRSKQSGRYRCQAVINGKIEKSPKIRLFVVEAMEEPVLVEMDPRDHVRIVGEPFRVTCRVTAPSHKYDIRWVTAAKSVTRTRHPSYDNENYIISDTLLVPAVTMEDSGKYTCIANNSAGFRNASTVLQVVERGYVRLSPVQDTTQDVALGENVKMQVHVEAYPELLHYGWKHTNPLKNSVSPTVKGQMMFGNNWYNNTLFLNRLQEEEGGFYTFYALNNATNASVTFTISVRTAPRVCKIKVPANDSILQCVAIGYPAPRIEWYQCPVHSDRYSEDYMLLLNDSSPQVVNTLPFQEVEVESVVLFQELGANFTFCCVAVNSEGNTSDMFHSLTVTRLVMAPPNKLFSPILSTCVGTSVLLLLLLLLLFYKYNQKPKYQVRWKIIEACEGNNYIFIDPTQLPYNEKWEFPRNNLQFGKTLGAGAFGKVVEATAFGLGKEDSVLKVAVKMLKSSADTDEQEALMSELKIMSHLGHHENIVNLLGACTHGGPILVITEYCRYGDLLNFLRKKAESIMIQDSALDTSLDSTADYKNIDVEKKYIRSDSGFSSQGLETYVEMRPVSSSTSSSSSDSAQARGKSSEEEDETREDLRPLNLSDLLQFSSQVAQGMAFLASKNCIHRDLAARNVLISDGRVAKICDFGLARDIMNDSNYVVKGNARLPVKWMAPESIFDCIYTVQSDVWSYGILLWEIFSLGKSPYPGMVVNSKFYSMVKQGYQMARPDFAPLEMYSIMQACWSLEPTRRPTFDQIGCFIQKELEVHKEQDYTNLPSTAEEDSGCDTSGCCEESCEQEESGQPLLKSNNYQFC
ncbi:CSF1R factor, partial [Rhinopomastus cyanomelas]|nr:CSF1R factor [Rhinopomastus cyanomelas]